MRFTTTALLLAILLVGSLGIAHADDRFRLCVDEWPPYEQKRECKIEGLCVATVRAVLDRMGVTSRKMVSASWERCLQNIERGDDHAALSAVKTKDRMKYAFYPQEPLTISRWVFFIRKDHIDTLHFRTLDDLEGRRIGIVKGFHYPPDLLAYAKNHAKLEYARDSVKNFQKLQDNRLDFVFEAFFPGVHMVEKLNASEEIIPLTDTILTTEKLYVIFSKESVNPEFVRRFSEELKRYKETEEYKAMVHSYNLQRE